MHPLRLTFAPALAALLAGASHACGAATPLALPPDAGMCVALEAYLKAGRLQELETPGVQRLHVGGRTVNVDIRYAGTGLAPHAVVTDPDTGEEIDAGLGDLDGEVRGDGAIVTFRGLHHVLLTARENTGGLSVALDGGPSCEIEHLRTEEVVSTSPQPGICRRLVRGDGPVDVGFTQPVAISDEALAVRWNGDAGPVEATGAAQLDVANDGHPLQLVQLTTSLRQPDLCVARLWDVLADHGMRLANDAERRALAARGVVASAPADGADCYTETHFLLDGRRVLIESLGHAQSDASNPGERQVDTIDRGRLRAVCQTTSVDDWRVTPKVASDAAH
jgi:hypothetical protein